MVLIDTATSHSDLGILFDDQLKFNDHATQVTTKAIQLLEMIEYLTDNFAMLTHLFSMLV